MSEQPAPLAKRFARLAYQRAHDIGLPVRKLAQILRQMAAQTLAGCSAAWRFSRDCLQAAAGRGRLGEPLCLVVHDAHRHGAQLLALELAETLSRRFRLRLHIVLLGAGPLAWRFARYGRVYQLHRQDEESLLSAANLIAKCGVANAICNSVASGLFCAALVRAGIRCVALVHELPRLIESKGLQTHAAALGETAAITVFPSATVQDSFPPACANPTLVRPQGLARRIKARDRANAEKIARALRRRLKVPEGCRIVLNMGYGDLRKGVDLFVRIGAEVMGALPDVRFVWVGGIAPEQRDAVESAVLASGFVDRFVMAPFQADVTPYLLAADVFVLTSREDPFPSVVLQAMDAGLPVVAFDGSGGSTELIRSGAGMLAPAGDTAAFAAETIALLEAPDLRMRMGEAGRAAIRGGFGMERYAFDVADLARAAPPKISAVVPNYNYGRYLGARLRSIASQTLPPYEIIVVDDCSTDDSLAIAEAALCDGDSDYRIFPGQTKSGSVFQQWLRGAEQARGDLVWIAEADDLSAKRFLETVAGAFSDPDIVLSYCQSRQIDDAGGLIDKDYLTYTSDIDPQRWRSAYQAEGLDEIRSALAVKNTIPNVSACIFRKAPLLRVLEQHFEEITRYPIAGDWMTYIRLLEHGRVAYDPQPLNDHRRHQSSVTARALTPAEALREIEDIQDLVRKQFAPPARVDAAARTYAAALARQFGLA